ncbi:MAG: HD domain-containing protein [Variibacter sp.]
MRRGVKPLNETREIGEKPLDEALAQDVVKQRAARSTRAAWLLRSATSLLSVRNRNFSGSKDSLAVPRPARRQDMDSVTTLTERFDRALLYATHVHGGQARKGTPVPYIAHLLAVSATVLEYGGDEELAIAALLHDSVEDQGGKARLADVRNRFGDRVARVVAACSDSLADTAKGEPKADWEKRKEAYVAHLDTADEDVLRVSLADKVHNARAILRDLRKADIGEIIWTRFSQPREKTLWYYRSLADKFRERLPGQLAGELHEIVDVLERSSK